MADDSRRADHIALVLHDFSGGGSERIAIRLAQCWAAAGRRVTIVAGTEAGVARRLADGLPVIAWRQHLARRNRDRIAFGFALPRLIDAVAPDVIVSPGNWHLQSFVAAWVAGLRVPAVAKISNPIRYGERGPPSHRLLGRGFAVTTRRFAALIAMSPALAADAEGVLGRPVATIAEPNLPDDWTPPAPAMRATRPRRLVAAGRMMPQKDFPLALATLAALGDDWHLDLLGDGRDRAALAAEAARLQVAGRVTFHGHVADTAPFLRAATAYLCTSRYEGYPAVLIEALAAGTPVVTTPCSPAVAEIVSDASFGRIVAPEATALAAAVRAVAGTVPDPALTATRLAPHRIGRSAAAWLDLLDLTASAASPRAGPGTCPPGRHS